MPPLENNRSNYILKNFILGIEMSRAYSQYGSYDRGLESVQIRHPYSKEAESELTQTEGYL